MAPCCRTSSAVVQPDQAASLEGLPCNLLEIDPVAYLADVLPALARGVAIAEIRALTPASWKDRKQA
jgi:hypothetical protein